MELIAAGSTYTQVYSRGIALWNGAILLPLPTTVLTSVPSIPSIRYRERMSRSALAKKYFSSHDDVIHLNFETATQVAAGTLLTSRLEAKQPKQPHTSSLS